MAALYLYLPDQKWFESYLGNIEANGTQGSILEPLLASHW